MLYVPDVVAGSNTYVPICMDCICASCKDVKECDHCKGTTEDSFCCSCRCVKEEDEDLDF